MIVGQITASQNVAQLRALTIGQLVKVAEVRGYRPEHATQLIGRVGKVVSVYGGQQGNNVFYQVRVKDGDDYWTNDKIDAYSVELR